MKNQKYNHAHLGLIGERYDRTREYLFSNTIQKYGCLGGNHSTWFDVKGKELMSLYTRGFKYYTKRKLGGFGSNLLLKVIDSFDLDGKLMCVCVNTINMQFIIPATEVLLVEGK